MFLFESRLCQLAVGSARSWTIHIKQRIKASLFVRFLWNTALGTVLGWILKIKIEFPSISQFYFLGGCRELEMTPHQGQKTLTVRSLFITQRPDLFVWDVWTCLPCPHYKTTHASLRPSHCVPQQSFSLPNLSLSPSRAYLKRGCRPGGDTANSVLGQPWAALQRTNKCSQYLPD